MVSHPNREKAQSLLKQARITQAPVDVNKIAALLGFTVIPYPFPNKRKGMVYVDGVVKAIGVNSSHPIYLQRYTVAHELGHFVNGHEHYENAFIEDDTRYYNHQFQQEREADLFASELLLPKDFLIQDLARLGLDETSLVDLYLVSKAALWIRLNTLRLAERYARK